jgi:hypothetical protein
LDADRFDLLTRVLAETPSRRTMALGLFVGAVGLIAASVGADGGGRALPGGWRRLLQECGLLRPALRREGPNRSPHVRLRVRRDELFGNVLP